MFEVVKRKGAFVETLAASPHFADREAAVSWAQAHMKRHPGLFPQGLEARERAETIVDPAA
jgi:hypothetical protein